MDRVNLSHIHHRINEINIARGFDDPKWNTIGSIRYDGAYGKTRIVEVLTEGGCIRELTGFGTKRETYKALAMVSRVVDWDYIKRLS